MPTATLTLAGSLTLQPPTYPPSAAQAIAQPISEVIYVGVYDAQSPTLAVDGPVSIPFPIGMTNCNFFYLKVQGGSPVVLQLTSADGTLQSIPVDSLYVNYYINQPVTAIKVTRAVGVSTPLTYFIAQNA